MVQTTLSWGSNGFKSNASKSNAFKSNASASNPNTPKSKAYDSTRFETSDSNPNTPSNSTPSKLGNSRFHNQDLRAICHETKDTLPLILTQLPTLKLYRSTFHHMSSAEFAPLRPENCPGFTLTAPDAEAGRKGTRIRVYDQDSFDAALELQPGTTVTSILPGASTSDPDTAMSNTDTADASSSSPTPTKPVAVLNLASERHPGGGWENGTLAQEEALCYRSSLYLSLHRTYYPLPLLALIYTPRVLLVRDAISRGHTLLFPATPAADLPVTSVITVAALRRPETDDQGLYARNRDRDTMKQKIRGTLRIAVLKGHRKLVLGALGCGAFGNPPEEVAECFVEVFEEKEFQGGWWEDVVFAILDNAGGNRGGKNGVGNYGIFYRALNGVVV